jgi:hypothetical protein
MPASHATYCGAVDPKRNHLPNVPWLRFAIADCASTTVCP